MTIIESPTLPPEWLTLADLVGELNGMGRKGLLAMYGELDPHKAWFPAGGCWVFPRAAVEQATEAGKAEHLLDALQHPSRHNVFDDTSIDEDEVA